MAEAKKRTALDIIRSYDGPKIRIMEVCGTHTHEIFRQGIRQILPPQVDVISGPGCPVCVTPVGYIDQAIWLALEKGVTICTFGDLVRVPGSTMSLADARSEGAHVIRPSMPTTMPRRTRMKTSSSCPSALKRRHRRRAWPSNRPSPTG